MIFAGKTHVNYTQLVALHEKYADTQVKFKVDILHMITKHIFF